MPHRGSACCTGSPIPLPGPAAPPVFSSPRARSRRSSGCKLFLSTASILLFRCRQPPPALGNPPDTASARLSSSTAADARPSGFQQHRLPDAAAKPVSAARGSASRSARRIVRHGPQKIVYLQDRPARCLVGAALAVVSAKVLFQRLGRARRGCTLPGSAGDKIRRHIERLKRYAKGPDKTHRWYRRHAAAASAGRAQRCVARRPPARPVAMPARCVPALPPPHW